MAITRQARKATRRTELVDAATTVFMTKGVSATSVDDIVQAAGAAKGTFYLYFKTKDDAVNAVAERIVDGVATLVEAAAATPGLSPVERLLTLAQSVGQVGTDDRERELIEVFHRPENRMIHDRLSERIVSRLLSTVEKIIADGIEARVFRPQDPRLAAGFVLATFSSMHDLVEKEASMERLTAALNAFILGGLGYAEGAPG